MVGSGDVSVRTLIPTAIIAAPYRKALIANLFFRQILALTDTFSVSFSDLMSTIISYLSLNTGSAEREAETAVATIRSNSFLSYNLQRVRFADVSGKHIAIPDPDNLPTNLTSTT